MDRIFWCISFLYLIFVFHFCISLSCLTFETELSSFELFPVFFTFCSSTFHFSFFFSFVVIFLHLVFKAFVIDMLLPIINAFCYIYHVLTIFIDLISSYVSVSFSNPYEKRRIATYARRTILWNHFFYLINRKTIFPLAFIGSIFFIFAVAWQIGIMALNYTGRFYGAPRCTVLLPEHST